MHPDLLESCELAWSSDRRVTVLEGAVVRVLRKPPEELVGRPLHEVLGVPERRAVALDARARSPGGGVEFLSAELEGESTILRLNAGVIADEARAHVTDALMLVAGAPPLQIARLASSLSHEIRNPLSSVKMAVQTLARNTGLSERDQRRLTIANREIRTMERMLGLLSEYGRDIPHSVDALTLRAVVQDALALVAPEIDERGIRVDFDEPADIARVRVDAHRLRLVLAQFLLNVAMGLEPGSPLIVVIRPGPENGAAMLVHDPAAAVLPEERATLFEPFGSRLARGAGLSLAALRRVLQSEGGDVSVEGLSDRGALFTLTFPG
ncbi:MAG: histidine kinase dimerization/phospho-acceptor domain-containing protein [Myxococcaceae bacterium]